MAPVAECNLDTFYMLAPNHAEKLRILCCFFGCLASALRYLHNSRIRHRDIKPANILVRGDKVYVTDFGISLDWENLTRGTTTRDTAKTLIYCAPEVARVEKRNSSSDIWSLGCVFLEMWTVIHGRSIQDLRQYFRDRTESHRFYENRPAITDWMAIVLPDCPTWKSDVPTIAGSWIDEMLRELPQERPSAHALYRMISNFKQEWIESSNPFCGGCCIPDDESSDGDSDGDPLASIQA